MSNPFDQFDEPVKQTGNPFDQFDAERGQVATPPPQTPTLAPPSGIPTWNGSAVAPGVGERVGQAGRVLLKTLASPFTLAARAANKVGLPQNDLEARVEELAGRMAPAPTEGTGQFVESLAKAAPAFAIPGGWIPQIAGNAVIGAVEAPEGETAKGAAKGAAFGTVGKVLSKTLGGLVTPTAEARTLMDKGVALTPGQAAGAGTFAKRAEEWAASNPISGTPIRGAQRRAVEDANIAATQTVADRVSQSVKLGRPPREAIEQTRDLVGKTYDEALQGMTVPGFVPETWMRSTIGKVTGDHPMIEQSQVNAMGRFVTHRLEQSIKNAGGSLSGPQLKVLDSELGSHIRRLQSSTNAADKTAAPAWRDLQQSLREVMELAQGDPAKVTQLKAANVAYRELLALERSLLPGAQQFTPRQLQRNLDKMGINNAELRTVGNAMEKTLPNSVPDSGTAERLIANSLPALLMGGGAGAQEMGWDTVGTGMIAAGALGTRPGARFLTGGVPGQAMLSAALRRTTPAVLHATTRKGERK